MKSWPAKDPDEVLDYLFDWSPRLPTSDAITTATATVLTGDVVRDRMTVPATRGRYTVTWLSGGTDATTCEILLHVETAQGRVLEETVSIAIASR